MKDRLCAIVQHFLSIAVNFACFAVCGYGIYNKYSILDCSPAFLYVSLVIAIVFLAYLEGLHFGIVSAQNMSISSPTLFPRAFKIQTLIFSESKVVQRFLIGRQLMVILTIFLIAEITTFPDWPIGRIPYAFVLSFRCGLPGILLTLTFGQLLPQLHCEEYTIEFLNLPGCYSIVYLGLILEKLGISHFSWLLFRIFHINLYSPLTRTFSLYTRIPDNNTVGEIDERNPPEFNFNDEIPSLAPIRKLSYCEWFKFIYSTLIILFCFILIIRGISLGYAVLPFNSYILLLLFFASLTILFFLEGLMIAIVSTQRLVFPENFHALKLHVRAYLVHDVCNTTALHEGKMNNVKKFIMGRQFLTVSMVFLLSQITIFPDWNYFSTTDTNTIHDILTFILFRSGIPGALVVLSISQLLPQLLASEHPWNFMDKRGSFSIVIASLATEAIGITHLSRVLFYLMERIIYGKRSHLLASTATSIIGEVVFVHPNSSTA